MTIRKTPTILIVEDDGENRAAMVKVLEGAENKVLETDNGQQALDIIKVEAGKDRVVRHDFTPNE